MKRARRILAGAAIVAALSAGVFLFSRVNPASRLFRSPPSAPDVSLVQLTLVEKGGVGQIDRTQAVVLMLGNPFFDLMSEGTYYRPLWQPEFSTASPVVTFTFELDGIVHTGQLDGVHPYLVLDHSRYYIADGDIYAQLRNCIANARYLGDRFRT